MQMFGGVIIRSQARAFKNLSDLRRTAPHPGFFQNPQRILMDLVQILTAH